MPRYEIALLMKVLERPETVSTMKGLLKNVMNNGNVVRKIQCLGSRGLPASKRSEGETHRNGMYFILDVHAPTTQVQPIRKSFLNDKNVLFTKVNDYYSVYKPEPPCGGMNEPDYEKLLEEKPKQMMSHPYSNDWSTGVTNL
uniref:28S ribosomal protein S6, mitochondrial-like n=1 Tax=Styela clava TaxID=7725 RepID=UPI00193A26C8|nr:28S ribosomal protein S6, mitochondrial-like [Styela clava]